MDDRNEEDENQNQLDAVEDGDVNSDSDDVMEVDDVDDKNVATPDSELVDSDVNVEAAELTNSDVDLSDESDIKGDLSSEADSVPGSIHADSNQQPEDDSVVDSDEETFALEIKDAKEEDSMDDEEEKDEGLDGNSASSIVDSNPTKNTSAVENDDSVEKTNELKRADEKHHEKEDEEDVDRISSKDEAIKTEDEHTDVLHNGESVSSPTRIHDHSADTTDDAKSTTLPKVQTKDEEATVNRKNSNVKEHDSVSVDVPNFIGFDSDVTNKTLQILFILQQHYQDLQNQPQMPEANDADQTAVEEDIEQPSQPADATSVHVSSPTKNEIIAEETSHEKQSDEQINKRIKKKRKFFDEFDNSEVEPSKKLKEQRDSTSSIEISSSENKENLISSEKLSVTKEDSIAASVSTSATALSSSTPNPPTRPETKGKFDITNPDFKEPFKYGWKREVVYRFISEDGQKKSADVSYFTPQGKKLRSIKQINENLPKDGSLHIKNFTFSKELIFRNRESELEVTRFTKKMEMELLTNESSEVSSDNIIDRRLGIEPISSSLSSTLGDDSITAKKTPVVSSSKKKEAQKSKSNVKTPTAGTEGSGSGLKSKSSAKKSTKNAETEDETSNATPKLVMPKILLRGPNAANSNSTSKVTAVGKPSMKIKIAPPPAKQSSQKTTIKKVTPSSKSNKNSKSLKRDRNGDADTGATLAEWKTSDRSLHSNINGVSANEWDACQTVGNRTATEYQSSFSLSNISRIYEPLLMSLKYLTVRDLLRISMTSKFLNRIASDPYLWKTVRLRNSQVHDWKGFAKTLQKYGTKRLDMRKMLCSNKPEDLNRMWEEFLEVIPSIRSLEHIDFSRTPMTVVDTVAATCPNLCVVNALYLKNGSLTLDNFAKLERLTELRLKGVGGIDLKRNDELLHFVNKDHLREISLTCIKNIDMHLLKTISGASNLVTLELGECAKLPTEFANEIAKLTKLEKLRLEKLEDLAPEYEILTVINNMEKLKSLELINIEVKDGFDEVLAQCTNLENFLIIPLYATQSATTNQLILHGIRNLSNTLKCFVWGLTIELLKVTDLFMDQWQPKGNNSNSQKKSGDSIPIRKIVDKPSADGDTAPTHVDILPVPKLERILATYLPHARVKVLKTPLQMTWRQSLAECFK